MTRQVHSLGFPQRRGPIERALCLTADMDVWKAGVLLSALWLAVLTADYLTDRSVSLNAFYMIPLCFTTWCFGRVIGFLAGAGGAVATLLINGFGDGFSVQATTISPLIAGWNSAMRFLAVALVILFVSAFRRTFDRERANARIDPLTGISNRRGFEVDSARLALGADRDDRTLLYGVIDVDDFKQINDERGHDTGDDVLRTLATALGAATRPYDAIGRMGGDEFAFCLTVRDALAGERKCADIHQIISTSLAAAGLSATCTIGAVTGPGMTASMACADHALYEAKRNGKNRWSCVIESAVLPCTR